MSELYQLPAGTDVAPDLPPVNLPVTGIAPPPGPLKIRVSPVQPSDPFAGLLRERPPEPTPQNAADPFAGLLKERPPTPDQPQISGPEAIGLGAINSASFGAAPALSGVHAAGMDLLPPEVRDAIDKHGHEPVLGALIAGLGRLGYENLIAPALGIDSGSKGTEAYKTARNTSQAETTAAQEQHPGAYLGGQLGGALLTPTFGIAGGATAAGRIGRGLIAGATGGGLYGAGTSLSEGASPGEIAKGAASGAATGAAFGTVGSAGMEALGKGANKVASIWRGARDVDAEAARRVVDALRSDFERAGSVWTPELVAAAKSAGIPTAIIDAGQANTRALAHSVHNTSPQGRQALDELVQPRFEDQSSRAVKFIRNLTGGGNATQDLESLQTASRSANRPAYRAAYVAGDRPIRSPGLERLVSDPQIVKAAEGAVTRGKTRAVLDGFGGFNPGLTVTADGRLLFHKGKTGVPTYPNLQFWDYTQRELRDMASAAEKAGKNEKATAIKGIRRMLLNELDAAVPEFRAAREGALAFFKGQDAIEKGREFVMGSSSLAEARKALAGASAADRELFAHGFASDLADKISRIPDKRSILNSIFLNNSDAKQRIELALGSARAKQLETYLRAETLVDEARKSFQGSNTVRNLAQAGLASGAGGGAVAALEDINGQSFDVKHVLAGAFMGGALRHGAKVIDQKVARRVGEMLASNDPAILSKGVQLVAARPVLFDALRVATGYVSRVSAHDIGPVNAAAGVIGTAQGLFGGSNKPIMDHLNRP